jgi:sterol desaturase/sphingolipid hydroxylase (fatty acid hydroxylase superfamily)
LLESGPLHFPIACAFALLLGSLVEYIAHRLMHDGKLLKLRHARHHRNPAGQGWFGEFKDYLLPGLSIIWLGFLVSVGAGIGFALGCTAYAAFAAYAHQLQHERPELVFWMPRPVHFLHHRDNMWRHNFGISVDIWDRVFGTYRAAEWQPTDRASITSLRTYLDITW